MGIVSKLIKHWTRVHSAPVWTFLLRIELNRSNPVSFFTALGVHWESEPLYNIGTPVFLLKLSEVIWSKLSRDTLSRYGGDVLYLFCVYIHRGWARTERVLADAFCFFHSYQGACTFYVCRAFTLHVWVFHAIAALFFLDSFAICMSLGWPFLYSLRSFFL